MAISPVKKIQFIALEKDKGSLFELLQALSIVEIIPNNEKKESYDNRKSNELDKLLLDLEESINLLNCFAEKENALSSIVKLKPLVYQHELQNLLNEFNYRKNVDQILGLKDKLNSCQQQKQQTLHKRDILYPWRKLSLSQNKLHASQNCAVILGTFKKSELERLTESLEEKTKKLFIEIVDTDKQNYYLSICCLRNEFEIIELELKKYHFNFFILPTSNNTAEEEINLLNRNLVLLDTEIKEIKDEICLLTKVRFKLMAVYDSLANKSIRGSLQNEAEIRKFTFSLTAWVRQADIDFLQGKILEHYNNVAIFINDPSKGDKVPVALENKEILQPFEAVTDLYGRPLRNGVDPTGLLAPFFTIAFSFCLLDAGYGLILSLITLIFLKKKQLAKNTKNFLKLFLFMGIATIFAGLITGSFFGDLITRLPEGFSLLKKAQASIKLFDPAKDSFLFLGLALAFGFIQIWTGIFIKFWNNLNKFKNRYEAFFCDLPTLLIQTGLIFLLLIFANVLPKVMLNYVVAVLIFSGIFFVIYQWTINNEMSLKIFWSIFGLYSVVSGNFLSDTLSFSRIFALGLTGTLLGSAMNEMLFPKNTSFTIISFLVTIGALIVLLFVHIFIFAITMLGAYVHTSRLQYLEFFNKFFVSGGRPFKPFRHNNKYTFLTEN